MSERNMQDRRYDDRTQGDTQIGDTQVDYADGTERVTDMTSGNVAQTTSARQAPADRRRVPMARTGSTEDDADDGCLPDDRMTDLRARWDDVQASFVDNPRVAVQDAHDLVERTVEELTTTFSKERDGLENQWNSGNVDTEALRLALQRYRSFFNRLLVT